MQPASHPFAVGNAVRPADRAAYLMRFLRDEDGALYPTTSFLMVTLVVSIPLGLIFLGIYFSLCAAGRLANFLVGLF